MDINGNFSFSNLANANSNIATASERIASGQRINSAQDDAAGLAISNRTDSQIRGFSQTIRNANDGISLLETASGSLSGITDSIQRIRELAIQASNGTLQDSDRNALNSEAQQLIGEVNRTIETTRFNNQAILKGEGNLSIQAGPNSDDQFSLSQTDFSQTIEDANFLDIDLSSATTAREALSVLDDVQGQADLASANIGAETNRLESVINSAFVSQENASASRSRIQDADFAKEISQRTSEEIKKNASLAMLIQSNADKGNVLKLLDI